jgi:hypothetical protein
VARRSEPWQRTAVAATATQPATVMLSATGKIGYRNSTMMY